MCFAGSGVAAIDLSLENSDLLPHPEDAVWAISSKWQQQSMGRPSYNGEIEALLPDCLQVEPQRWSNRNWDGWQVAVPLRRCHDCHTVGLDVDTGPTVGQRLLLVKIYTFCYARTRLPVVTR
jgi:hypothetical protein